MICGNGGEIAGSRFAALTRPRCFGKTNGKPYSIVFNYQKEYGWQDLLYDLITGQPCKAGKVIREVRCDPTLPRLAPRSAVLSRTRIVGETLIRLRGVN